MSASNIVPPVETTFPVSPDELENPVPPVTLTTTVSDSESAEPSEPITPPVESIPEPVRVGHDRIVPPVTWPASVTNIPG